MRVKSRYCRTTRVFIRAKIYGRLHLSGYKGKAVNGKALYPNLLVTSMSSVLGKYRSRFNSINDFYYTLNNRPVHALSCIMGNQRKMVGNSKVCMGFQSQLILPELIYLTLSL